MEKVLIFLSSVAISLSLVFLSILIYAAVGCWLWGLIMVPIFNLPALSYWEIFGLMWLLRLLFGSSNFSLNSTK